MHLLYLDESGEFGSAEGSSKHLLIATLFTDEPKRLKNVMRKEKKALHDLGWPIDLEIKGSTLFGAMRETRIPRIIAEKRLYHLNKIIERILGTNATPHYAVMKKSGLKPHLKSAPYGIAYNYFTGCLLCKIYPTSVTGPMTLIVDRRNKETHSQMPFDGYIKTRIISECSHDHVFDIKHEESGAVLGLQAVDFISWGLFRHYEHGDSSFKKVIEPHVGICDNWYA